MSFLLDSSHCFRPNADIHTIYRMVRYAVLSQDNRYYAVYSEKLIIMRAGVGLVTASLTLLAPTVWGSQSDSAWRMPVEREVLKVQASCFQAIADVYTEELANILADDLTYKHTFGEIDTKIEFLSSLQSQTLICEST